MADTATRTRPDRCPGVLRPWPADDGGLVRVRLVGGEVSAASLTALGEVATTYGDGDLHLTGRANLQLRGLPLRDGALPAEVVDAIEATGLLPSRSHELVRNVMVSPLPGPAGVDLLPVGRRLDALLLADPALAVLPGRFLFVLDAGGGDLVAREADLGAVALSGDTAQLRIGATWGPVVPLTGVAAALVDLARRFLDLRGDGPTAAWHVHELAEPLVVAQAADDRVPTPAGPLPFGPVAGGRHVAVPDGVLTPALVRAVADRGDELRVTPWQGVLATRSTTGSAVEG